MTDINPRTGGRPRKWQDAAERSRAYRARKARELAEPERLRRDLNQTRVELRVSKRELVRQARRASDLEQELASTTARASAADRMVQGRIVALERQVAALTARAEAAEQHRDRLKNARQEPPPAPAEAMAQLPLFALVQQRKGNPAGRRAQVRRW